MQGAVVLIIIAIVIAVVVVYSQAPERNGEISDPQKTLAQVATAVSKKPKPEVKTKPINTKEPSVLINTYITFGPRSGDIIDETNKVTFGFKAEVPTELAKNRVYFETKIEGFEEKWKRTSSKKRTITLPIGPGEYTFLVRAKVKDIVDPTPVKRTFRIDISPYFGKIKISRVNPPTPLKASLITLRTSLKGDEEINITDWEIEAENRSFTIPQGIEKYDPINDPFLSEEIIVKRGDKVYISSAQNPLERGKNFRPNKCFGHLVESHEFLLSVPNSCPRIEKERISHLEPMCQKYIKEMDSCGALVSEKLNEYDLYDESECVPFIIDNFGYSSCLLNYSDDKNFFKKEWHIYLNKSESEIMDEKMDTLYLRDQDGFLVDKYSYGMPWL